ncbi:uncharacterized protein LOC112494306 [Cephus cinctus]|uniref:Uncharacterized protein LOC112494306 n=1 Tax=Cephus cinctus TaxID=211228 RepID=A0AAJ7W0Z2_CEPCN|nr:uncharacterized protein LOC112494306 [Cephus cinctus]XP_024940534.1 uncharacterized protein LOC112494306 [Cephus cinctus]
MNRSENSLFYELSTVAEVMIKSKVTLNHLQEETNAMIDLLPELDIMLKNPRCDEDELKSEKYERIMKMKKHADSQAINSSALQQKTMFTQEFPDRLNKLENSARTFWLSTFMLSSNYLSVPQPPLRCDWYTPRKRSIPRIDVKF